MHPHEVEFQIRNLSTAGNYKRAESILIELKNYSGPISENQLSRFYFAIITTGYNCYNCKAHIIKIILSKLDKYQYDEILEIID